VAFSPERELGRPVVPPPFTSEGGLSVSAIPTVLIIDDEPDVTSYLETVLSDHGFATHSANSADEALERLGESRPDLILLDLMMPLKSGINLFNKIKKDKRYQDIPVVIVTGIQERFSEDFRGFFEGLKLRKPSAFVEKPVNPEELVRTVKRELGLDA